MARPEYIDISSRNRLFENTLADPNNGIRDHALLRLMFGTFLRPIEIIRLKTAFFVDSNGRVFSNPDYVLTDDTSFNGKERPMPISNAVLIDALQRWVDFRIEKKWGVTSTGFIDLDTALFMSKRNTPFSISTTYNESSVKHNCESLNRVLRKRMKINGITGSIESAARTLTLDIHRNGGSTKALRELRGDASIETTKTIIEKDPVRLSALVENAF